MVECSGGSGCPGNGWYHYACVQLTESEAVAMAEYLCRKCSETSQPMDIESADSSMMPPPTPRDDVSMSESLMHLSPARPIASPSVLRSPSPLPCDENQCPLTPVHPSGNGSLIVDSNLQSTPLREVQLVNQDQVDSAAGASDSIPEGEYVAQEIIGHRKDSTGRQMFLVHWQGYDRDEDHTWLYEDDLRKCDELVPDYCSKHPGVTTRIKRLGGASVLSGRPTNVDNWISLDLVKSQVLQHLNMGSYKSSGLEIVEVVSVQDQPSLTEDTTPSTLFLVLHGSHFYSILYDSKSRSAWGSDGANLLSEESEVHTQLSELLGCPLTPLRIELRFGVDHCGSLAVGVALELVRMFKRDELGTGRLHPPSKLVSKIIQRLHPEPSVPMSGRVAINQRAKFTCRHCDKYSMFERKKVVMHERSCSKKTASS